jgi:hypothetical protein
MFGRVLPSWLSVVGSATVILSGVTAIIELSYSFVFDSQKGGILRFLASLDTRSYAALWAAGVALIVLGALWFKNSCESFSNKWGTVNAEIDAAQSEGAA